MSTLTKKQILIIEDHDSIRILLGKLLSKSYSVITKRDGLEGMAWLSEGNIPDLILLDMQMPEINGDEFLAGIRTSGLFSSIPVIVVSANDEKEMDYFKVLGVNDFMQKPFNPILLNDKIGSILHVN